MAKVPIPPDPPYISTLQYNVDAACRVIHVPVIIKNSTQRERKSQSERKRDNKRKALLRKRERGRQTDRKRDIYIEKEKSTFIESDINPVSA